MNEKIYILSRIEAAYVVSALWLALSQETELPTEDREIMAAMMTRLAAPMQLSPEVRSNIEKYT